MVSSAVPHVLVIDDDATIRALYRDLLEGEGYRVTDRADLDLSVAEVAQVAPDLIVLELLFERQNAGLPFLANLKADPATAAIPAIVCSSATDAIESSQEQLAAWNCGIAAKPFDIDTLLALARDASASP